MRWTGYLRRVIKGVELASAVAAFPFCYSFSSETADVAVLVQTILSRQSQRLDGIDKPYLGQSMRRSEPAIHVTDQDVDKRKRKQNSKKSAKE
jgi:hypothetical protein